MILSNLFREIEPIPSDVEVRIGRHEPNRTELLIYKTRQVDQRILDKTVGYNNWEAVYPNGKPDYCEIAISFTNKVGESVLRKRGDFGEGKTPKQIATDAFKRAAFSWGILTCLKDTPILAWRKSDCHSWNDSAKEYEPITKDRFIVTDIRAEGDRVVSVTIKNLDSNVERTFGESKEATDNISTDSLGGVLESEEKAVTEDAPMRATVTPGVVSRPSPIKCKTEGDEPKETPKRGRKKTVEKKEEPTEEKEIEPVKDTLMTLDEALSTEITIGSYKGKSVKEIFDTDKTLLPVIYVNEKDLREREAVKMVILSDSEVESYCKRNEKYAAIVA